MMDFKDDFELENSSNSPKENETASQNDSEAYINTQDHFNQEEKNNFDMKRTNKKGSGMKTVMTTIAAGVVGSVITLTVLPYTDYMKNLQDNSAASTQQISTVAPVVKPVSTTQSPSAQSIADTVDKVSKTIVGIVNYQQQSNGSNSSYFGSSGGSDGSSIDPYGGYGNSNGSSGGSYGSNGSSGGNNGSSSDVEYGSGSGVIFQKSGNYAYIVTNNHVVEGASKLEISLYNGQKTTASVVGTDALTDLAVLKIDSKYVTDTAQFGDSSTLRPGDPVYAIGNPLGLDLSRTVTEGIVSAINRSISVSTSAGEWQTNVIQTDAAINPGNSGGALITPQGLVVGINSLKISETGVEGIGFAIPSDDLIPIVNQLIKNGKVERPYLGVGLADLSEVPQMYWQNLPNNVNQGVMVTSVDPQSVAAKGGFQTKDVIVSMNGTQITSSVDLRKYLYTKVNVGDNVNFGVYRNGKLITLHVKITTEKAN